MHSVKGPLRGMPFWVLGLCDILLTTALSAPFLGPAGGTVCCRVCPGAVRTSPLPQLWDAIRLGKLTVWWSASQSCGVNGWPGLYSTRNAPWGCCVANATALTPSCRAGVVSPSHWEIPGHQQTAVAAKGTSEERSSQQVGRPGAQLEREQAPGPASCLLILIHRPSPFLWCIRVSTGAREEMQNKLSVSVNQLNVCMQLLWLWGLL